VLEALGTVAWDIETPEAERRPGAGLAEELRPVGGWEFDDGSRILP
jgi:hypothetical protein